MAYMSINDPIILDRKHIDQAAVWAECEEASDHVINEDGTTNWRAAHSADPGICHCPKCKQDHWAIGHWHKCTKCAYVYPSDAWAMFSWGYQQREREHGGPGSEMWANLTPECRAGLEKIKARRMAHPYYRYGYEHPEVGDDPWRAFKVLDWAVIFPTTSDETIEATKGSY